MKASTVLTGVALLGAIGFLGWGTHSYRVETRPVGPVEVEAPDRELGDWPVGKTYVVFHVANPTGHAAEVISVPDGCGKRCCLKPVTSDRLPIPPGGSVDVVCELHVVATGPFEFSGDIFLNDNGLRPVKFAVRGVGVLPRAGDAPKP